MSPKERQIHLLNFSNGQTVCDVVSGTPNTWPDGHSWTGDIREWNSTSWVGDRWVMCEQCAKAHLPDNSEKDRLVAVCEETREVKRIASMAVALLETAAGHASMNGLWDILQRVLDARRAVMEIGKLK